MMPWYRWGALALLLTLFGCSAQSGYPLEIALWAVLGCLLGFVGNEIEDRRWVRRPWGLVIVLCVTLVAMGLRAWLWSRGVVSQ